jgi:hypothetical protein
MKSLIRISLMAVIALSIAACTKTPTAPSSATSQSAPQFMFVQSAEDIKVDPTTSTFRLVKVNEQTVYFTDRPQRIAGHIKMPAYLTEWTGAAGSDNFSVDPPNATLSVYEPDQPDNTVTVVKISHPVVDGNDLVYNYKLIEGTMPNAGGATALFIDWIGPGGGVGPGVHGVGAGARGVGVRR